MTDKISWPATFECGVCGRTAEGRIGFKEAGCLGVIEKPGGWEAQVVWVGNPRLLVRCSNCDRKENKP